MSIIIWVLSLTTLDSSQYEFKGTMNECKMEASIIMLDKDKMAGCYYRSKTPPYIK